MVVLLVLTAAGAIAFGFYATGSAPPAALAAAGSGRAGSSSTGQVSNANIDDGRQLYLQSCASCHGDVGQGGDVAPALSSVGQAALDFYMRTGRMPLGDINTPAWQQQPTLSDDEIRAIEDYAATFVTGPDIPAAVVATAGDTHLGWQLYVNNCAACHSLTGNGGSAGRDVVAPPLVADDPQVIAEAMLIGPGPMPRFDFDQLQVDSIAAYIEYLGHTPHPGGIGLDGAGPVGEGFVAGLLGVGVLILIVRWVAGRRGDIEPDEQVE